MLLGDISLSLGGRVATGESEATSSSRLIESSRSHRGGSGAGQDTERVRLTAVGTSSSSSSAGGLVASGPTAASGKAGASKKARGGGPSSMSYSSGGREGKKEGGLGAVTVSTASKTSYSSGGSREGKKGSLSSGIAYSPPPKERKSATTMAAALTDVFDG